MSLLRIFWNALIPWRRRRRFYLLHLLEHLQRFDVPPAAWPATFGVSPTLFAAWLTRRATPGPMIDQLAVRVYRLDPPRRLFLVAPLLLLAVLPLALLFIFLALHAIVRR